MCYEFRDVTNLIKTLVICFKHILGYNNLNLITDISITKNKNRKNRAEIIYIRS